MAREVAEAYRAARRVFLEALGAEAIARLHRPAPILDWSAVMGLAGPVPARRGRARDLARRSGLAGVLALQGFVIQGFGYAVHDLFVHRRVGGEAGYYPAIPFYRIPRALRLMRPILLARGARDRSMWELLRGWFWRKEPHRTVRSR